MSTPAEPSSDPPPEEGRASHGGRTEVNWDQGKGRQPYANQGEEAGPPGGGDAFEAGDRGDLSGRNVEQLEEAKKKP